MRLFLVSVGLFALGCGSSGGESPPTDRPFRIGFTGFPHDNTLAAAIEMQEFVAGHSDLLTVHLDDGVPWAESLAGQPYSQAFLASWGGKRATIPPGAEVFLALSPGRGELQVAGNSAPLPAELVGRPYDDPTVVDAYTNYCQRAIDYFSPAHLAIGIESNEMFSGSPQIFADYVELYRQTRTRLQAANPGLPIFATISLHAEGFDAAMMAAVKDLAADMDTIAISYYPFLDERAASEAFAELFANFDSFDLPYAIAETNEAAENTELPQMGLTLSGSPAQQADYYEYLLDLAADREFLFVTSFIHRDYDALWEKIQDSSPEFFKLWKDTGLQDGDGVARPALQVWDDWLALPLIGP